MPKPPELPRMGVVMPTHGPLDSAAPALRALAALDPPPTECIVVTDSPPHPDDSIWLPPGARRVEVAHASGPAVARNAGAAILQTDIVLFVDSDVVVPPDTVRRFAEEFRDHPGCAAVFGSYDDQPADPGFLSQYRNLLHHFVHQTSRQDASTFWSGLGAVRLDVFRSLNGFDESYRVPSIEDVELGCRMHAAGHAIRLSPEIRGCHLKRWTAWGILRTDLLQRGIPWVRLALSGPGLPSDLNLGWGARASVALAWLACGTALMAALWPPCLAFAPVLLASVGFLNRRFYRFLIRHRGIAFAAATFPWQILYHLECGLAVLLGIMTHAGSTGRRIPRR